MSCQDEQQHAASPRFIWGEGRGGDGWDVLSLGVCFWEGSSRPARCEARTQEAWLASLSAPCPCGPASDIWMASVGERTPPRRFEAQHGHLDHAGGGGVCFSFLSFSSFSFQPGKLGGCGIRWTRSAVCFVSSHGQPTQRQVLLGLGRVPSESESCLVRETPPPSRLHVNIMQTAADDFHSTAKVVGGAFSHHAFAGKSSV